MKIAIRHHQAEAGEFSCFVTPCWPNASGTYVVSLAGLNSVDLGSVGPMLQTSW